MQFFRPKLLDVATYHEEYGTGLVTELFYKDRRIILFTNTDPKDGGDHWVICSNPYHKRDGCGYLTDKMTTEDVIKRGTGG